MTINKTLSGIIIEPVKDLLHTITDRNTRRSLKHALPRLTALIENICPVVATLDQQGFTPIAYGPFLHGQQRAGSHLFLFASPTDGAAALCQWPDQAAIDQVTAKKPDRSLVWANIDHFLRTANGPGHVGGAIVGLAYLTGLQGRIQVEATAAAIRKRELFPAVCALVSHDRKQHCACGLMTVIGLPMPVDLALADSPAVAQ
jgi:hypothetical protein